MAYLDAILEELSGYQPALTRREDFDAFWERTLEQTRAVPLCPTRQRIDYPSDHVAVYEITYHGFDDTPIHGWYLVPSFLGEGPFPCLIHYHGFTGDRGMPQDFLPWVMLGMCVVSIDCRDQNGHTGSLLGTHSGATQSVVCRGVLDPGDYYYRAVYMDCVKAIDFAQAQPEVDGRRIVIEGGSQGGALGMAVAALDPRPMLALVDVPSNSNIEARIEGNHGSFSAVADYLKQWPLQTEQVFATLSYFDTMNLADRIRCRVLASVGLKDTTCPAKLYFASYNRIPSQKDIRLYPFNGHEGGGRTHAEVKLRLVREVLAEH